MNRFTHYGSLVVFASCVALAGCAVVSGGLAVGTVDGLDLRSRNIETLDEIISSALDYYSLLKSITRQRRQAELREALGFKAEPQELIDMRITRVRDGRLTAGCALSSIARSRPAPCSLGQDTVSRIERQSPCCSPRSAAT